MSDFRMRREGDPHPVPVTNFRPDRQQVPDAELRARLQAAQSSGLTRVVKAIESEIKRRDDWSDAPRPEALATQGANHAQ